MWILIVEDDAALCRGIELTLKEEGRNFVFCHTLQQAQQRLQERAFDLLLLDINLPDGSGLELCQEIRSWFTSPILFLTANDTELDMVTGLEIGGDDYLTKPFSLAVLRARVNALLRRSGLAANGAQSEVWIDSAGAPLLIDHFSFDFAGLRFTVNGQSVELSKTEQRLLQLLVTNRGQTLSRERLLAWIWPDGGDFVDENALSVAIRRLRTKLEQNPSDPQYIKTIYGIGYLWAVPK